MHTKLTSIELILQTSNRKLQQRNNLLS